MFVCVCVCVCVCVFVCVCCTFPWVVIITPACSVGEGKSGHQYHSTACAGLLTLVVIAFLLGMYQQVSSSLYGACARSLATIHGCIRTSLACISVLPNKLVMLCAVRWPGVRLTGPKGDISTS